MFTGAPIETFHGLALVHIFGLERVLPQREGDRVCQGCDGQIYCLRCWTMEHKSDDMATHKWNGADSGEGKINGTRAPTATAVNVKRKHLLPIASRLQAGQCPRLHYR